MEFQRVSGGQKTAVLAEQRIRDGVFLATIHDPDIRLVMVVVSWSAAGAVPT